VQIIFLRRVGRVDRQNRLRLTRTVRMPGPIGRGRDDAVEQPATFSPADPAGGAEMALRPGIDEMLPQKDARPRARPMSVQRSSLDATRIDGKGSALRGVGEKPFNSCAALGRSASAGATSNAPATGQP
jgi:hypothetical protein